mgnify:CR=1 FL=1
MTRSVQHHLAILAVCAATFFVNLGGVPLWDRDETRNARCAMEMLERQDWIVPYYNGEVRVAKPALKYWFMMSAVAVFGPGEWAFRFWSAVAGTGAALLTYHLGRRLFCREAGFWSALVLATCLLFAALSRTAKVDALLILFDTAAMWVYVAATFRGRGDEEDERTPLWPRQPGEFYPGSPWAVAAIYALLGLAVLGKGPIGLIPPVAVLGVFLLIQRLPGPRGSHEGDGMEPRLQWRCGSILVTLFWLVAVLAVMRRSTEWGLVALAILAVHLFRGPLPVFRLLAPAHVLGTCLSMRPLLALAAAAAVAGPWHLWVAWRDVRWIKGFYLENNLGRALNAMEGHGGSDLLYNPKTVALGCAPWSVFFAPVAIDWYRRLRRDDPWRRGYLFVACWAGVYLVLLSLAETKLPNYVGPAYPALAMAIGCYVYHLRRSSAMAAAWWPKAALGTLAGGGILAAAGVAYAAHCVFGTDAWLGLVGLIPVACAAVCGVLWQKGQVRAATAVFAGFAVVLNLAILAGVADRVRSHDQFGRLAAEIKARSHRPRIATYECIEPSWVHYLGQNLCVFSGGQGRAAGEFLARGGEEHFLLTTSDRLERLRPWLPEHVTAVARVPLFLKRGELVVLAAAAAVAASPAGPGGERAVRR